MSDKQITTRMRQISLSSTTLSSKVPLSGEIVYETDTKRLRVGNGSSTTPNLAYLVPNRYAVWSCNDHTSTTGLIKLDRMNSGTTLESDSSIATLDTTNGWITLNKSGNYLIGGQISYYYGASTNGNVSFRESSTVSWKNLCLVPLSEGNSFYRGSGIQIRNLPSGANIRLDVSPAINNTVHGAGTILWLMEI